METVSTNYFEHAGSKGKRVQGFRGSVVALSGAQKHKESRGSEAQGCRGCGCWVH